MKTKRANELMDWLNKGVRDIDLPRDYTPIEVKRIIDIVETEMLGGDVKKKIREFKKHWFEDCDIKSQKVKDILTHMTNRIYPKELLLSDVEVIHLIEITESELTD